MVVISLGNGKFQVREVDLGINGDQVWEVRGGVSEGDKVVTSSQFLIDSESNLRAAIQKTIASRRGEGVASSNSGKSGEEPDESGTGIKPVAHNH